MYNKSEFENLASKHEGNKKLNVKSIVRLISVLENKNIVDDEIAEMLSELIELINFYVHDDKAKRKEYRKTFAKLRNHVAQIHKLQPKGTYTGMGVAIGSGIGVAFSSIESLVGVGLAIGVGLGVAIGSYMESQAEKEGRLY